MELYNEDLGLTFGHYGWEPQMYIYLPFFRGSSERDLWEESVTIFLIHDHVGDHILNLESYYFPAGPAGGFQQHLLYKDQYKRNFDYSVRCLRVSTYFTQ